MAKIRHIDFYPDEYVAGVTGKMSPAEQGVYWMICSLVYSKGGPIDDDHVWLSRLFDRDTHWRTIRATIDRLIAKGKVEKIDGENGSQIMVTRCARELQKAHRRSAEAAQNGRRGGRPRKENNTLPEPEAFGNKKLTTNLPTYSVSKDTAPDGADVVPIDPRQRLFSDGLQSLMALTGRPESNCRSLLGRWLKMANDDAKRVLRSVEDARDENVADAVPWIEAAIKQRSGRQPGINELLWARH